MDEKRNDNDALATAFLQSELMDETADYLARGRHLEQLSPDQLNDAWERAFRTWFSQRDDHREMNDCDAELRLRSVEPPYERVESELREMHAEAVKLGQAASPEIRARIAKFMDSKDNPQ
jgi:hypothetical protein